MITHTTTQRFIPRKAQLTKIGQLLGGIRVNMTRDERGRYVISDRVGNRQTTRIYRKGA